MYKFLLFCRHHLTSPSACKMFRDGTLNIEFVFQRQRQYCYTPPYSRRGIVGTDETGYLVAVTTHQSLWSYDDNA